MNQTYGSSKLWECTYKVISTHGSFYVKDWIFSTSMPSQESIGYYWKHLFPEYLVTQELSYLAPSGVDFSNAHISREPF